MKTVKPTVSLIAIPHNNNDWIKEYPHFRGKIRVLHPLGAQKPLAGVRTSKKTQTLVEIFAAL